MGQQNIGRACRGGGGHAAAKSAAPASRQCDRRSPAPQASSRHCCARDVRTTASALSAGLPTSGPKQCRQASPSRASALAAHGAWCGAALCVWPPPVPPARPRSRIGAPRRRSFGVQRTLCVWRCASCVAARRTRAPRARGARGAPAHRRTSFRATGRGDAPSNDNEDARSLNPKSSRERACRIWLRAVPPAADVLPMQCVALVQAPSAARMHPKVAMRVASKPQPTTHPRDGGAALLQPPGQCRSRLARCLLVRAAAHPCVSSCSRLPAAGAPPQCHETAQTAILTRLRAR